MALNIKSVSVERLAEELSRLTGESKTAVILRALEERKERLARRRGGRPRLELALDFLEKEIWPEIPKTYLGRAVTKKERERALGYGKDGV